MANKFEGGGSPKKEAKPYEWTKEIKTSSFGNFLKERGISPEDEKAKIARDAWNAAIEAASKFFSEAEGTDYNIADSLVVPEPKNLGESEL